MLTVKLLAFDSFSGWSMATFVETDDITVLIDPCVSLAPIRENPDIVMLDRPRTYMLGFRYSNKSLAFMRELNTQYKDKKQ